MAAANASLGDLRTWTHHVNTSSYPCRRHEDLVARMRWIIDFTPRRLCPQGSNSGNHWMCGWVGCRAGVTFWRREKSLYPVEIQTLARPARSPVTMQATLLWCHDCCVFTPHWPDSTEFNKEIIVDRPVSVFLSTVRSISDYRLHAITVFVLFSLLNRILSEFMCF